MRQKWSNSVNLTFKLRFLIPCFGTQDDLHSAILTLSLTNDFLSKLPLKYLNLMDYNIYEHLSSSLSSCTGLLMI